MGAKRAKRNHGSHRREMPEPDLPYVPEDTFYKQGAVCWKCRKGFRVRAVNGPYLKRTCPLCGASLAEDLYDAEGARVRVDLGRAKEAYGALSERQHELESDIEGRRRWWQWPWRIRARRELKRVKPEAEERRCAAEALRRSLNDLRFGRYHAGEWFLSTHIPLAAYDGPEQGRYRLKPAFDGVGGAFNLDRPRTSPSGKGIVGEFLVFEAVRKRALDPASPLFGARLVPNIYLPETGGGADESRLWNQIDLVVVTAGCAFVIEAKRRYADIVADAPFEHIRSSKPGPSGEEGALAPFDGPLRQNSVHAVSFAETCKAYPFERVYEAVVFVNARSFASDGGDFEGNVFVGCVPQAEGAFIGALERACTRCEPLMTREEAVELGDSLINAYGDLNQRRRYLHIARIERLRA